MLLTYLCEWQVKGHNFIRQQQLNIVSEMSETTQQKGMLKFLLYEVQSALIWNGCSQQWLLISQEFLLSFKHVCFVNVSAKLTCVFNVNGMTLGEKCLTYLADVFQCEYRVKFLWKTMHSNKKLQKMTNA